MWLPALSSSSNCIRRQGKPSGLAERPESPYTTTGTDAQKSVGSMAAQPPGTGGIAQGANRVRGHMDLKPRNPTTDVSFWER